MEAQQGGEKGWLFSCEETDFVHRLGKRQKERIKKRNISEEKQSKKHWNRWDQAYTQIK